MTLVDQWNAIERSLDPSWGSAQLALGLRDDARRERAAALLGPANPGRSGDTIGFFAARGGGGIGPEAIRRLLRRLDAERIDGTLRLVASEAAPEAPEVAPATLAGAWDGVLGDLPSDWSDLYGELELESSDHVDRAALLLAPLNPLLAGEAPVLRFRCAHTHGYGASAGMVRRCLARLDEVGIPGSVRVLRVLSDTHPVQTQGPVWHMAGRTV